MDLMGLKVIYKSNVLSLHFKSHLGYEGIVSILSSLMSGYWLNGLEVWGHQDPLHHEESPWLQGHPIISYVMV